MAGDTSVDLCVSITLNWTVDGNTRDMREGGRMCTESCENFLSTAALSAGFCLIHNFLFRSDLSLCAALSAACRLMSSCTGAVGGKVLCVQKGTTTVVLSGRANYVSVTAS